MKTPATLATFSDCVPCSLFDSKNYEIIQHTKNYTFIRPKKETKQNKLKNDDYPLKKITKQKIYNDVYIFPFSDCEFLPAQNYTEKIDFLIYADFNASYNAIKDLSPNLSTLSPICPNLYELIPDFYKYREYSAINPYYYNKPINKNNLYIITFDTDLIYYDCLKFRELSLNSFIFDIDKHALICEILKQQGDEIILMVYELNKYLDVFSLKNNGSIYYLDEYEKIKNDYKRLIIKVKRNAINKFCKYDVFTFQKFSNKYLYYYDYKQRKTFIDCYDETTFNEEKILYDSLNYVFNYIYYCKGIECVKLFNDYNPIIKYFGDICTYTYNIKYEKYYKYIRYIFKFLSILKIIYSIFKDVLNNKYISYDSFIRLNSYIIDLHKYILFIKNNNNYLNDKQTIYNFYKCNMYKSLYNSICDIFKSLDKKYNKNILLNDIPEDLHKYNDYEDYIYINQKIFMKIINIIDYIDNNIDFRKC